VTFFFRFSESSPCEEDRVLRSPSRLGYSEDIPPIIIQETAWENSSQDSNKEDFKLNLKGKYFKIYYMDVKSQNFERLNRAK